MGSTDRVWLALRLGFLFLSPRPSAWAPYAFVHLGSVIVHSVDNASLTVVLAAKKPTLDSNSPAADAGGSLSESPSKPKNSPKFGDSSHLDGPQMQVIFLLPDGR